MSMVDYLTDNELEVLASLVIKVLSQGFQDITEKETDVCNKIISVYLKHKAQIKAAQQEKRIKGEGNIKKVELCPIIWKCLNPPEMFTIDYFDELWYGRTTSEWAGRGFFGTIDSVSRIEVRDQTWYKTPIPDWATHVVWYR